MSKKKMKSFHVQNEDCDDSSIVDSGGFIPDGVADKRDSLRTSQPTKRRKASGRNRFVNGHGGKRQ